MKKLSEDELFERMAEGLDSLAEDDQSHAPADLKSRIYSSMIFRQDQEGPLRILSGTKAEGRGLCLLEDAVRAYSIGAATSMTPKRRPGEA